MKFKLLILAVSLSLCLQIAHADGIVFLSGDAGFVLSPINPSDPRLDAGNQQFLQNVLQGGTEVVIRSDFFDVPRTFVNDF